MRDALRQRWPEYLIEAWGLGTFMVSACLFAALLEHPGSIARQAIADAGVRRLLMGLAMGLTAYGIFRSPWGRRSGAHISPAVTLALWRLGRIRGGWDVLFYVLAQFGGGLAGVLLCSALLGPALAHPAVAYVVTVPGEAGAGAAFAAELVISFGIMAAVLFAPGPRAPLCAAILVAAYITLEAPLSGTSMNFARTVASAAVAGTWTDAWLYLFAPLAGMFAATELHRHIARSHGRNITTIRRTGCPS
jgi:aquaporin Z